MNNKITYHKDKPCTNVKIFRLPTQDKTNILNNTYRFNSEHGNPLSYVDDPNDLINWAIVARGYEFQHLYFTSDENYDIGDSVIYANKVIPNVTGRIKGIGVRKIIATTDPKLYYTSRVNKNFDIRLPQPTESFIKEYCDKGGIDEVLVEMEEHIVKKECGCKGLYYRCGCLDISSFIIKIDHDNDTISIHQIKTSWNREEVEKLFHKYEIDKPNIKGNSLMRHDELMQFKRDWLKRNI